MTASPQTASAPRPCGVVEEKEDRQAEIMNERDASEMEEREYRDAEEAEDEQIRDSDMSPVSENESAASHERATNPTNSAVERYGAQLITHVSTITSLLPGLYILWCRRERNRGYTLLMAANKPETALYRAPTFSLLLVSHGGISLCSTPPTFHTNLSCIGSFVYTWQTINCCTITS